MCIRLLTRVIPFLIEQGKKTEDGKEFVEQLFWQPRDLEIETGRILAQELVEVMHRLCFVPNFTVEQERFAK